MSTDTPALRSRLRDLSATLKKNAEQQRELRVEQLDQLRTALAHRGTISEAARASGLSRAYLHKIELHLQRGSVDAPEIHAAALARAEEIRRQIAKLEQKAVDARAKRDPVIRELRLAMSTADIAADAGITGERARIILQETSIGA